MGIKDLLLVLTSKPRTEPCQASHRELRIDNFKSWMISMLIAELWYKIYCIWIMSNTSSRIGIEMRQSQVLLAITQWRHHVPPSVTNAVSKYQELNPHAGTWTDI